MSSPASVYKTKLTIDLEIPDEDKKRRVLHLTCCLLPKSHRDSLEILFSFLVWVSSFSQVDEESGSKMDTHNLATVISPNILKDQDTKKVVSDESFLAIEAVNTLIEYNDQMCEVCTPATLQPFFRLTYISSLGSRRPPNHPQRLFSLQQRIRYYHQRNFKTLRQHRHPPPGYHYPNR